MPNRIAFRYVDSADAVQHFTCDINPLIADLQFGLSPTMEQTVDGEPIVFLPGFDSRTRTLKWAKLPQKTPYTTMINNIKELEGLTSGCQIQRNDLDDGAGSALWERIRVLSVSYGLVRGPASATHNLSFNELTIRYVHRKG